MTSDNIQLCLGLKMLSRPLALSTGLTEKTWFDKASNEQVHEIYIKTGVSFATSDEPLFVIP